MDRSEAARIESWFHDLPEVWQPVTNAIRELLMDSSPRMNEEWKYKTPFYSHSRAMCYLSLQGQKMVLGFVHGTDLADPCGILAHTDHRSIRHFLPSYDPKRLPVVALRGLIQEAIAINEEIYRSRSVTRGGRSK
ncbi:MAG: DUF1801 domain-containing protein [Flavobacteriales bacterium]|nr:DUF1801 domain-containing protein [Flavobacteriales bacterium]MBP6643469.1 DUF1801 domain-containing protein [Flavobacteriales bacterium]MBP7156112.1 DUF1801 domain-containing protein [Flavobacteriales bacterium]HQW41433.1 DUF1801 domain-containing protein [Flavobacteriales bacterium]